MSATEFLYVGTFPRAYRSDPADTAFGVYAWGHDPETGEMSPAGLAPTPRPGWVTTHPGGRFLYAANEVSEFEGRPGGGVSAFAIDPANGRLSPLGSRPAGASVCHCVVDATGRFLLASAFHSGTVHLFPIEPDGRLGPALDVHHHRGSSVHPRRQAGAHAHAVVLDPANRFVLVPDLGTDSVVVYELDGAQGRLVPHPDRDIRLPPGSGPRHAAFHPSARFVYLVNEMSATVTVFSYDAGTAALRALQTVATLPDEVTGYRSAAGLAVHPRGDFLYVTTRSRGTSAEPEERGVDSLVWFAIDQDSGRLTPRGRVHSGGEVPRSLTIGPDGTRLYVGNQGSGTVTRFDIDALTGAPRPTGRAFSTPVPVCLHFATPRP
ncbi:lactonase family protein [Streptomyces hyderabadensis]|uniref:Lactonase family protein n=1 Tax=Streptomyces hyderabadensis TaxID=598549 RepID=A0ABP9IN77_9ACTN|nr:lactonase family protein [Streptomyces hyderabadensis]